MIAREPVSFPETIPNDLERDRVPTRILWASRKDAKNAKEWLGRVGNATKEAMTSLASLARELYSVRPPILLTSQKNPGASCVLTTESR